MTKGWASLGNNTIWRQDGAVVYPFASYFMARHPLVGDFIGKFNTMAEARDAVDTRFPLDELPGMLRIRPVDDPKVVRVVQSLYGHRDVLEGVVRGLTPFIVGPWLSSIHDEDKWVRRIVATDAWKDFAVTANEVGTKVTWWCRWKQWSEDNSAKEHYEQGEVDSRSIDEAKDQVDAYLRSQGFILL